VIVIGIDIGLTGAVSAVDSRSAVIRDMPTIAEGKPRYRVSKKTGKKSTVQKRRIDGRALLVLIRELVPIGESAVLVFEDVSARAAGNGGADGDTSNSMRSQGSMMQSKGIVQAVGDITRLRIEAIQPQAWKRHFGLLKAKKEASLKLARDLYPTRAHELTRVKDHNRAEALLIARYGSEKFA
jgi:hypothetical protein